MRAILERLHASRLEDAASHSSGEEEGEEEIREGELSEATIRRILARVGTTAAGQTSHCDRGHVQC